MTPNRFFFSFAWIQVHEKTIMLPLLPITLLVMELRPFEHLFAVWMGVFGSFRYITFSPGQTFFHFLPCLIVDRFMDCLSACFVFLFFLSFRSACSLCCCETIFSCPTSGRLLFFCSWAGNCIFCSTERRPRNTMLRPEFEGNPTLFRKVSFPDSNFCSR